MKSLEELRAAIREAADLIEPDPAIDRILDLFLRVIKTPGNLIGLREVAGLLGIDVSAANMRAARHTIPAPVAQLSYGRVWTRWDIEAYLATHPAAVRHNVHREAG
jgi:hypothetical protein